MLTEARKKANMKYEAKTYDKITFRIKKNDTIVLNAAVQKSGLSKNAFILQAINEYMKKFE